MNSPSILLPGKKSRLHPGYQPRELPEWAQLLALLLCVLQFCQYLPDRQSPGTSLYTFTYGYDLVGNATVVGESYPSGLNNRTVNNSYDAINRLGTEAVTGSAPNVSTSYVYDSAKNRSSKVITGGASPKN